MREGGEGLSEDEQDEFEERAAMLEYCAGFGRARAEQVGATVEGHEVVHGASPDGFWRPI